MIEDKDPLLQALFNEVEDLDDTAFIDRVNQRIAQQQRLQRIRLGIGMAAAISMLWILSIPFYAAMESLTLFLTSPLISLGDGFLPLMFSPINNLASILILIAKLMWSMWKRIHRVSFAT